MSITIAISGKGGTGKTTLAALLIEYLEGKGITLAVDADPNTNLNEVLGIDNNFQTVGDLREEMARDIDKIPAGMTKQQFIEYKIETALVETNDFDFLAMGRPEGPGCYCYANQILRQCIDILSKKYDYVVIDCEAGLEHLSRRTTRDVDILLIVSDPSKRGLETAKRISELANELKINIKKIYVIITKLSNNSLDDLVSFTNLPIIGTVPDDEMIKKYDFEGLPLTSLPADAKVRQIANEIFNKIIANPDVHRDEAI